MTPVTLEGGQQSTNISLSLSLYIYVCIYIYICIDVRGLLATLEGHGSHRGIKAPDFNQSMRAMLLLSLPPLVLCVVMFVF